MNGACKIIFTPKATRSTRPIQARELETFEKCGNFTPRFLRELPQDGN
jgi:hypothetical protein